MKVVAVAALGFIWWGLDSGCLLRRRQSRYCPGLILHRLQTAGSLLVVATYPSTLIFSSRVLAIKRHINGARACHCWGRSFACLYVCCWWNGVDFGTIVMF